MSLVPRCVRCDAPIDAYGRNGGSTLCGTCLAEEGGNRALTHAELQNMSWGDRAYRAILMFCERRPAFTIEQVKAIAYARGLPKPPAEGAWGPITKRAEKSGHIKSDGYIKSRNPSQHGKPVVLWRVQ